MSRRLRIRLKGRRTMWWCGEKGARRCSQRALGSLVGGETVFWTFDQLTIHGEQKRANNLLPEKFATYLRTLYYARGRIGVTSLHLIPLQNPRFSDRRVPLGEQGDGVTSHYSILLPNALFLHNRMFLRSDTC